MSATTEQPPQGGEGDDKLVELLKSQVTSSWGRTIRAGFLILCWGLRRWPIALGSALAAGTGLLALIAR
jgi:hypothetical protein